MVHSIRLAIVDGFFLCVDPLKFSNFHLGLIELCRRRVYEMLCDTVSGCCGEPARETLLSGESALELSTLDIVTSFFLKVLEKVCFRL